MTSRSDGSSSRGIAYLILAHAADEQLRLLCNALLADPRSTIYLHLDAKLFQLDWVEVYGSPRLVVLPNRITLNWAGYSLVEATLQLLRAALSDGRNEQFVLLSGTCFPLKPVRELNDRILARETPSLSLWGKIDPGLRRGEGLGRYVVSKFHPYDVRFLSPKASGLHARAWSVFKWINARLPYERPADLRDLWKGSQFFIIPRGYAEACARPPAGLAATLRYAMAPDEIFFTTIIVRHARAARVVIPETSMSASRQGEHFLLKRVPASRGMRKRIFGQIDLRRLLPSDVIEAAGSGASFARKCDAEVSNVILDTWGNADG